MPFLTWLIQGAAGPALVGLPVTWAATDVAAAARQWFRRWRRADDLSRIVRAAGGDVDLSDAEFLAIRQLLEQESTWLIVGRGTVEDLAELIGSCLQGRENGNSLLLGRMIALGLLEFAVRDLEPEWFAQVLMARLDRLQADQASALDELMLSLHSHLDRLPACPADQGDVAVYLTNLIRSLNSDPWPQDTRFAGPALTPAAIERQLRITSGPGPGDQDLDADDLARKCQRLVVLGGPGSGKTWLAKRTARLCAETALTALAAGACPDEVELPLYTTCARLSAEPLGQDIRRAIIASALGLLPDMGGARTADAVRALFEERNAATLLVVDSLDEARGVDERIGQADSLPSSWRIMLTSRPASWNGQLAINGGSSRRVGLLQPLRYPDDIDPFIAHWFTGEPERAASLAAELRDRPALQLAATVPLVLAFYCIIGGDQALPGHPAELHAKVIRRMLTGRWRGSGDHNPDPDACLETLRGWAWSAAASNPLSGVGEWEDEFATPWIRQSRDDQDALNHVAVPLGPADPDTGKISRRFVHRSLREHLVAEFVALAMPTEEAVSELLKHLWYDADWKYSAAAAVAMHPQREQVLKKLISRVVGDDQIPADLAAVDGCWELRRFLARLAQESGESDWPHEVAEMIGQARVSLARRHPTDLEQVVVGDWPTSNRSIIDFLLEVMADSSHPWAHQAPDWAQFTDFELGQVDLPAEVGRVIANLQIGAPLVCDRHPELVPELAEVIGRLETTAEDLARSRQFLLDLLADESNPNMAEALAKAVARLNPTAEDQANAREILLSLLASEDNSWRACDLARAVAGLNPAVEDLTGAGEDRAHAREILLRLLASDNDPRRVGAIAKAVATLNPTAKDQAQVREILLRLLRSENDPGPGRTLSEAVTWLDPRPEEQAQVREVLLGLLAFEPDPELPRLVAQLANTTEDRVRVRASLLELLAIEIHPGMARALVRAVTRLAATPADRAQTREALIGFLAKATYPSVARRLAEGVGELEPTARDRARAREILLRLLATEDEPWMVQDLADALTKLEPTAEDRVKVNETLFALLGGKIGGEGRERLAKVIVQFAMTAEERARGREWLLSVLGSQTDPWRALELAGAVANLSPTAQDLAQAGNTLLGLLASETDRKLIRKLADGVANLDPTAQDVTLARNALLALLTSETDTFTAMSLASAIDRMAPTRPDRALARQALLGLLVRETGNLAIRSLLGAVAELDPDREDREVLLGILAAKSAPDLASVVELLAETTMGKTQPVDEHGLMVREFLEPWLADTAGWLAQTSDDRAEVRAALLGLLASEARHWIARDLADAVASLSPTAADLGGSGSWPVPPTSALWAAARRNTPVRDWLATLPLYSNAT